MPSFVTQKENDIHYQIMSWFSNEYPKNLLYEDLLMIKLFKYDLPKENYF